jgi:hypothetical protein
MVTQLRPLIAYSFRNYFLFLLIQEHHSIVVRTAVHFCDSYFHAYTKQQLIQEHHSIVVRTAVHFCDSYFHTYTKQQLKL